MHEIMSLQIAMASVAIQQQLCAMSHEDSRNILTEERQVEEFLSSVSKDVYTNTLCIILWLQCN